MRAGSPAFRSIRPAWTSAGLRLHTPAGLGLPVAKQPGGDLR
ncbi:hypothetical protein [Embleya scabrispora]|nr:hypothetical protein [Embleya scabrispora]